MSTTSIDQSIEPVFDKSLYNLVLLGFGQNEKKTDFLWKVTVQWNAQDWEHDEKLKHVLLEKSEFQHPTKSKAVAFIGMQISQMEVF